MRLAAAASSSYASGVLPMLARAILPLALLACGCGGCRRGSSEAGESTPKASGGAGAASSRTPDADKSGKSGRPVTTASGSAGASSHGEERLETVRDRLWAAARDDAADDEDFAALAVHEGAAGLVAAAAADPTRVRVALRAAPSARGYAHVPWLAEIAGGEAEDDARLALEALADVGARVRRAEEHEDEEELEGGCARLAALARSATLDRARRVSATRAVRMLPCPKLELPTDLDAR